MKIEIPFKILFDFENKKPCFGATLVRENGGKPGQKELREIYINGAAIIMSSQDEPEAVWSEITAETVIHEVLHQVQAEFERGFAEYEIDKSIEYARDKKGAKKNDH